MGITERMLLSYLFEVSEKASRELCEIKRGISSSKFIIPQKTTKDKIENEDKNEYRISEQELRIPVINAIQALDVDNHDIMYSIETPTDNKYLQKGKTGKTTSGRSDLSLYEKTGKKPLKIANIEFKYVNAKHVEIQKDLEKIFKEGLVGAWFHLLNNTRRNTLDRLFEKFIISTNDLVKNKSIVPSAPVLFTILILNRGIMISRVMSAKQLLEPDKVFKNINHANMLKSCTDDIVNGWTVTVM